MRKAIAAAFAAALVLSIAGVASACPFGSMKDKESKESVSS